MGFLDIGEELPGAFVPGEGLAMGPASILRDVERRKSGRPLTHPATIVS